MEAVSIGRETIGGTYLGGWGNAVDVDGIPDDADGIEVSCTIFPPTTLNDDDDPTVEGILVNAAGRTVKVIAGDGAAVAKVAKFGKATDVAVADEIVVAFFGLPRGCFGFVSVELAAARLLRTAKKFFSHSKNPSIAP